jgi:beta-lactamase regulating signal transducer with metallopeptidase domain
MPESMQVVGWLATYLVHSTLWLGAVLLLTGEDRLPVRLREYALRLALCGGLVTAFAQCAFEISPCSRWFDIVVVAESPVGIERADSSPEAVAGHEVVTAPSSSGSAALPWPVHLLVLLGYGLVLLLGLLLRWGIARRLHRLLADRVEETSPRLQASLRQAAGIAGITAPVALSRSARIRSPIAWGFCRPEICLPSRSIVELDPAALRCVLLHELAHLRFHDPIWQWVYRASTWLFWCQPLNRLVVRRLQHLAEYRCDDFAIRHGCGGTALARTLLTVAEWQRPDARLRGLAPAISGISGMVASRSLLGGRVRRALHGTGAVDRSGPARVVLALPVLLGIAWGTPAVTLKSSAPVAGPMSVILLDDPSAAGKESAESASAGSASAELEALRREFASLMQGTDHAQLDAETRDLLGAIARQFDRVQRLHDSIVGSDTVPLPAQPEKEQRKDR